VNNSRTVEEIMDQLRTRIADGVVDWAYVLGMIEFYAHDTGDPEVRLQNIRNTITAFDRLRAERQGQIVEADLDEIRGDFCGESGTRQ
jgi:hypothetical protein